MENSTTKSKTGLDDETVFEASLISEESAANATGMTTVPPVAASHSGAASALGAETNRPATKPGVPGAPAAPPGWVGKTLGHFKLLRLLGEGSMGLVIQAEDVNLKRIVALKVLRKRIVGMDETQRVHQFLREARSAATIEHPNVIHIYEINQHEGWWYIAMEYLEGGTLQDIVKAAGPLSPAQACPIIADAATALAVAHQSGIVHRDIKPSNLMLTRGGRCKLTDFGLVRVEDPNDPFDFTTRAVGSPNYMAPEVIKHEKSTTALDVYSLGATLYFALTGVPPYSAPKVKDVLRQHTEAAVPWLLDRVPQAPERLGQLINRCMAKDPAERPTAAQFAAALRAEAIGTGPDDASLSGVLVGGTGIGSTIGAGTAASRSQPGGVSIARTPAEKKSHRRAMLIAGGVIVLAVVIGAMLFPASLPPVATSPTDRDALATGSPGSSVPTGSQADGLAPLPGRFPDAPETYGVLPAGVVPIAPAELPGGAPRFSWVGNVDPHGARFVASRLGRHYFPVDSPDAALISAENFVGYPSADAAEADGKRPAP